MSDYSDSPLGVSEAHAIQIARIAIKRYVPFRNLPERDAAGALLLGFDHNIEREGISMHIADMMLLEKVRRIAEQLRAKVFPLLDLSETRQAVLLAFSHKMGVDAIKADDRLWTSLSQKDYAGAARALMLSSWPIKVGTTDRDRERVLDFVDAMRTGHLLPDPSVRA